MEKQIPEGIQRNTNEGWGADRAVFTQQRRRDRSDKGPVALLKSLPQRYPLPIFLD